MPVAGLHFQAYGNFGSSVFDPAPCDPEHYMEIVICDECLINKKDQARVYNKSPEKLDKANQQQREWLKRLADILEEQGRLLPREAANRGESDEDNQRLP